MAFYPADDKAFSYMGRIDLSDPAAPLLIYAGSSVKCRFKGSSLKLLAENIPFGEYSAIGAVIDNEQYKLELKNEGGEQTLPVCEGLGEGTHSLVIFKRMGAAHYFRFLGIETDGELLPADTEYSLKLDVYGDSVSAGEVTEALYYEAHSDPEGHGGAYDNSWFGYPYILARRLNAELYNNSQGGLPLLDKTGYFGGDNLIGLETTYDKLSYVPWSPQGYTEWDFSRYIPDIVIIAIGQNDAAPDPDAIRDPAYAMRWKGRYKEIVLDLKARYGSPKFILMTTVLMHDPVWDDVIGQIADELDSPDVHHFMFARSGAATPGHPRATEQAEMADELERFIREIIKE